MDSSWAASAAIASIAITCCVYYSLHAWFDHRERLAKIDRGIDPDRPVD